MRARQPCTNSEIKDPVTESTINAANTAGSWRRRLMTYKKILQGFSSFFRMAATAVAAAATTTLCFHQTHSPQTDHKVKG